MDDKNIDIDHLIDEMALLIDSGMVVCLNVSTGETAYAPVESIDADYADRLAMEYIRVISKWDDKVEIRPVDLQCEYEFMEYFISDNAREGTRLYQRLTEAIRSDDPVAAFNREIVLCKGEALWREYRRRAVSSTVVGEIVETIAMPHVKTYTLDLDTINMMAQAHVTNHYVFVSGQTVIISQVVYHTKIDPDTCQPINDDYTIWEWAMQKAEWQTFHRTGGGLVYEPMSMYDEYEAVSPEDVDIDQVIKKIKRAVNWSEEQQRDLDDFCATELMIDELWDSTIDDYPDRYEGSEVTFVPPSEQRRNHPDGKFPIHGKADDEFSDDDPWKPTQSEN